MAWRGSRKVLCKEHNTQTGDRMYGSGAVGMALSTLRNSDHGRFQNGVRFAVAASVIF